MNKATLVFFRNEPLILFHGKQTLGYEGSSKSETLICLYRLPVWLDNILIFKCREQYCAFEVRVYLDDDPLEDFGTFSVNQMHRCYTKCKSDEVMWIMDIEKEQFFSKHQDLRYYQALIRNQDPLVNNCLYNLRDIRFADPENVSKLLIQSMQIEV